MRRLSIPPLSFLSGQAFRLLWALDCVDVIGMALHSVPAAVLYPVCI